MSILDDLASCDQNNCVEIDRVTDLIPKIIGFTNFRIVIKNNGAQQMVLAKSSLKVLQRLTSIGGEIGVALRICGDNSSDQELSKLVAGILRNLAIDRDTRQEIGHMQHAQAKLTESDLKELCHTLREVLERIMNVEGAELEILIGLCSHICKVIPKEFVQELEGGQIKKRFMKRLVDTLNANMNPGGHCSGIRRVIIEQSIYMMECNSHYANCFNELQMMEALSMVEEMPSRAENYRIFLGDVGFMEYSTPLIALVDRAKELMGQQCLQGVSSAN
ncbi:Os07g0653050 [Oryza sativa Japonica Group]|uniref:Os07g0653050 protein n=1 Tax=Oryza sativa subsp. japonica TaxID=39947 RepID=A0A0P0X9Q7_ORYSJ|nr:hypothetical protein EE612_041083 [Oryza sativa]BAT02969.1 Os07g0653050 [Oryza sativa Japonica Group]